MSFSTYDFEETIKGCGIEREQIKRVVAAYGVTEEACCNDCGGEWSGGFLLEMNSGKFAFVSGWCDYTGWGCQDGTNMREFDSQPALKDLEETDHWETDLPDLERFIRGAA